jgi:hypothetical protein
MNGPKLSIHFKRIKIKTVLKFNCSKQKLTKVNDSQDIEHIKYQSETLVNKK